MATPAAVGAMWLDCPDGAAGTSADTGVSAIIRYIHLVGVLVNARCLVDIGIQFILLRGKTHTRPVHSTYNLAQTPRCMLTLMPLLYIFSNMASRVCSVSGVSGRGTTH